MDTTVRDGQRPQRPEVASAELSQLLPRPITVGRPTGGHLAGRDFFLAGYSLRDVANGTRNYAMGLRRRMNALGGREGDGTSQTEAERGFVDREVAPLADAAAPQAEAMDGISVISNAAEVTEKT